MSIHTQNRMCIINVDKISIHFVHGLDQEKYVERVPIGGSEVVKEDEHLKLSEFTSGARMRPIAKGHVRVRSGRYLCQSFM